MNDPKFAEHDKTIIFKYFDESFNLKDYEAIWSPQEDVFNEYDLKPELSGCIYRFVEDNAQTLPPLCDLVKLYYADQIDNRSCRECFSDFK